MLNTTNNRTAKDNGKASLKHYKTESSELTIERVASTQAKVGENEG